MIAYIAPILLMVVGLYAIIMKKNLIKITIGFAILDYAVNLFFAMVGYKSGAVAPIVREIGERANYVDPLPQALVLTASVIGLGVTALMIALSLKLYEKYGTFDVTEIKRLRG